MNLKDLFDKAEGGVLTYDQLMATIDTIEKALKAVGSSISYVSVETFVAGSSTGASYNRDKLENNPECKNLLYERFAIVCADCFALRCF